MKVPVRGFVTLLLIVVAAIPLVGCSAPGPEKVVTNPDPAGKIPAYKEAVRAHDCNAVRQMVKDLDSDDPAVRLFAIEGLRRLTGETFDYKYYDDEHARRPALRRWQAWLDEDGKQHGDDGERGAVARDGSNDSGAAAAAAADGEAATPSKASGP
jgi:hypothetical protein